MIKFKKIKTLALSLGAVIFLASCTSNKEVPELLEPVGAEATFRPVETADMGLAKIIIGNVSGQEYCHFYEKMIVIKDINVAVGDYVNEGDILVEADLDSVKDQITDCFVLIVIGQKPVFHTADEALPDLCICFFFALYIVIERFDKRDRQFFYLVFIQPRNIIRDLVCGKAFLIMIGIIPKQFQSDRSQKQNDDRINDHSDDKADPLPVSFAVHAPAPSFNTIIEVGTGRIPITEAVLLI